MREPVLDLLPEPHRSALRHARAGSATASTGPRRLVLAAAGLLAGAATHNAWDAFTHASGAMVQALDPLRAPVIDAGGLSFRVFNLLQHASTLLGLAALMGVYAAWLRRQPRSPVGPTLGDELWRWAVLAIGAALAMSAGGPLARHAGFTGDALVFRSVIAATNVFVLLIVAMALLRRASPWLPGLPFIQLRGGAIHERRVLHRTSIRLGELRTIEYAYHAVVGFSAAWIFTARDGREIVVSPQRPGLPRLLADLEVQLPGFSREKWRREFEAGDVEDTLLVWTVAAAGENQ